jgi:hypothetical protein
MDRVLILFQGHDPSALRAALAETEILPMDSREELAHSLISLDDIAMFVCELGNGQDDLESLVPSVRKCFPLLPIVAIADAEAQERTRASVDAAVSPQEVAECGEQVLAQHVSRGIQNNRRQYHRFDWPLEATLYQDGESQDTRRVRALSAGGAYLEDSRENPTEGGRYEIEIQFQNFKLSTECTVLDRRSGSSLFPPGFGIRFEELSAEAQEFIDRVVNDALMEILLDPTAQPDVPTMDDDDLVLTSADEFELTEY